MDAPTVPVIELIAAKAPCEGAVAQFVADIESGKAFRFDEEAAKLRNIVQFLSYPDLKSELIRCNLKGVFEQRVIILHTRHANFHIQYDEAQRVSGVISTKAVEYQRSS